MNGKQIGLIVGFILMLPTFVALMNWSHKIASNPSNPQVLEEGVAIATQAAIPWWITPFTILAGLGIVGAVLIVGFVFYLKWTGEIR